MSRISKFYQHASSRGIRYLLEKYKVLFIKIHVELQTLIYYEKEL